MAFDGPQRNTQATLQDFFKLVSKIISEGTSDQYSLMVLDHFMREHEKQYPFVKYIHLQKDTVVVESGVNKADPKLVAKFIEELMGSLFSRLFKHLVKKKMTIELYEQFKRLGVQL